METNEKIIKNLEETFNKIRTAEEEYNHKKHLLVKELEDKKSDILERLGFRIGDQVTLELFEYRDDRIHCFQAAQVAECFIHGVKLETFGKEGNFLSPVLRKKDRKKSIIFNQYLSWDLKSCGHIILSHRAEQYIIRGTYTEEELKEYKPRLLKAQKI